MRRLAWIVSVVVLFLLATGGASAQPQRATDSCCADISFTAAWDSGGLLVHFSIPSKWWYEEGLCQGYTLSSTGVIEDAACGPVYWTENDGGHRPAYDAACDYYVQLPMRTNAPPWDHWVSSAILIHVPGSKGIGPNCGASTGGGTGGGGGGGGAEPVVHPNADGPTAGGASLVSIGTNPTPKWCCFNGSASLKWAPNRTGVTLKWTNPRNFCAFYIALGTSPPQAKGFISEAGQIGAAKLDCTTSSYMVRKTDLPSAVDWNRFSGGLGYVQVAWQCNLSSGACGDAPLDGPREILDATAVKVPAAPEALPLIKFPAAPPAANGSGECKAALDQYAKILAGAQYVNKGIAELGPNVSEKIKASAKRLVATAQPVVTAAAAVATKWCAAATAGGYGVLPADNGTAACHAARAHVQYVNGELKKAYGNLDFPSLGENVNRLRQLNTRVTRLIADLGTSVPAARRACR